MFTQHAYYLLWRDTTSELWTLVNSFTLIKTPNAIICSLLFSTFITILHTVRLILCFQQAQKTDNLPVSLGQSSFIVLCAVSRQQPHFLVLRRAIFLVLLTPSEALLIPTGSITLVELQGKIVAALHHTFLLGSPNEHVFSRHQQFLAPDKKYSYPMAG